MDLNSLSLAELKKLQRDVTSAIATFESRAKAKARAELEARAKELGFTLAEVLSGEGGKVKRAPAQVKYRNPANVTETWSGRGRRPAWFNEALARGKSPDDLAA